MTYRWGIKDKQEESEFAKSVRLKKETFVYQWKFEWQRYSKALTLILNVVYYNGSRITE